MEIHSRVNVEYDLRLFPHARALVERLERLGESSYSKDHHIVIRKANFSGTSTERIVNPHYNFLVLTVGISGSPTAALRETRITLADGMMGRIYMDAPAQVAGAPIGRAPLWGIPILLLKGKPLDLTLHVGGGLTLDVLEIIFRGIRF